ncbi:MAG: 1-(5-phosphoribosyl)-5-[(5-phosphoribosylamino)methylideneamino]imidazole-4-carboxamide isomerase [Solirubrobacterales bacterium]
MQSPTGGPGPELLPAIDIREGRAVRLLQGDYEQETRYDADPVDAARRWVDGGATAVHVVDLDGARAGHPVNLEIVSRIAAAVEVPVQLGGGLRDRSAVEAAFSAGAERAVLGTTAQRDPALLGELAELYGQRIVASVDARGNNVAVEGWEQATSTPVHEAIRRLGARGVSTFVYTPVEVDGTLEGPGLTGLDAVLSACEESGSSLTYSGGVGSLEDLIVLRDLRATSLHAVIVGRALYEGRFSIAEAIAALSGGAT